ncbi:MAG: M20/M25/M40 family metallo-hydrolase, partial [Rhodoferax sp.]
LQTIVSRQVDLTDGAAAVTVAQFNAGNRHNIIPESATLSGTVRTLTEPIRAQVHAAITRMAQKTAEAAGLTAEVQIERGYPVLTNDSALGAKVLGALEATAGAAGVRVIPPMLGSEDFGAFGARAPSFYWALNAPPWTDRPVPANHSALFQIDEAYLKTGVKAYLQVALSYLFGSSR